MKPVTECQGAMSGHLLNNSKDGDSAPVRSRRDLHLAFSLSSLQLHQNRARHCGSNHTDIPYSSSVIFLTLKALQVTLFFKFMSVVNLYVFNTYFRIFPPTLVYHGLGMIMCECMSEGRDGEREKNRRQRRNL